MSIMPLSRRNIPASRLVLGCMGLGGGWDDSPITEEHVRQAHDAVDAALAAGINMFDHADIYTRGKAESVFGQVLKERPDLREQIIIQSKCGIRFAEPNGIPGRYDFSKEHILSSVNGSLQRLGVEYLDILLLHRPDPLMDPEEVAVALETLKASGKVRNFGVSNMTAGQIALLQAYTNEPFIVNQLQMSLQHIGWLDAGVHVNRDDAKENMFPEGTLEYCQMNKIQIQAWSPLAQGVYTGRPVQDLPESIQETAALVKRLANEKETTAEAILLAWLMKHPTGIQPVIGTKNPDRIRACSGAELVELTREEWYSLYVSSRGVALP
ncbi:aldo/keto reductase [Paenibacillus sp. N3/727]|uniref:aldo/keto reductase n=1 Tax=Paenibacillus sp. N3/727 TaxID=2925845 RepID=UPI001F53B5DA|nr:aldo/keto reductase [Paenibacillus sp. N3/727]UNK18985.1 aldo/keto reductase [Paenibacillus sp. N3/727]